MSDKRNDIIEEQRRAREEFLKLKKMQHGEIEPEAKPSEVAIKPTTFSEKCQNYWYHYKVHTILIGLIVGIIAILVAQCATREKYDFSVLYFNYGTVMDVQLDKAEEYFEKFASDVDGNGEVNVQIINCSVSEDNKDAGRNVMYSKVQSVLIAEPETVLYIVDDESIEYFDNAFDKDLFVEEPFVLTEDFYDASNSEYPLPDDLKLGVRIIDEKLIEGDQKAIDSLEEARKVYEKVKERNG